MIQDIEPLAQKGWADTKLPVNVTANITAHCSQVQHVWTTPANSVLYRSHCVIVVCEVGLQTL